MHFLGSCCLEKEAASKVCDPRGDARPFPQLTLSALVRARQGLPALTHLPLLAIFGRNIPALSGAPRGRSKQINASVITPQLWSIRIDSGPRCARLANCLRHASADKVRSSFAPELIVRCPICVY